MKTQKLSFYALGAALALTAASCSNELPMDDKEVYNGPTETNFLRLNIVSGSEAKGLKGTRGANDTYTDDTDGNAQYQDGIAKENEVNKLRIYFFDANGNAAKVVSDDNTLVSYLDFDDPEGETTDDNNIEKVLEPLLIINTEEGDELPASIVAVLNPPTKPGEEAGTTVDALGAVASISDLNTKTGNYAVNTTQGFLMSNSIYVDNGQKMEAVDVTGHMYNNQVEALEHPVTVYVERVNAKARVTCSLEASSDGTANFYKTGVKYAYAASDNSWTSNTDDIYVKFLGWNVTCTTNKSNLMKEVSTDWTNKTVFGDATAFDWNSPTRFRSFWAINPSLTYNPGVITNGVMAGNYMYGDFNDAQAINDFTNTGTNYTYLQENAGLSATEGCKYPTQLIVAGQLCNSKGETLTLAEYGGQQFTLGGLKTQMANLAKNVYVKEGEKFVKITSANIDFITATDLALQQNPNANRAGVEDRYRVFANLVVKKSDTENYVYGMPNAEGEVVEVDINVANAWLVQHVKHAKIWEGGYTYYYIDIKHLGLEDSLGEYGIVRNHIYDMTINSLAGLGTPVYEPDEVIYPEHPDDDYTFIGAEINILNWRLVPQNVSFVWD